MGRKAIPACLHCREWPYGCHQINYTKAVLGRGEIAWNHGETRQRRRPPSKNNRNVLKISYIKGKCLGNRYLPLVFCAYSACSKCRIRGQNQGKCFPKIRSVFPKPFICFPKNTGCFPKKSRCFPDFRTLQTGILSQFE